MKSCPATNPHRVRQPARVGTARGAKGLAQRLAQVVIARFGLDRYEVIGAFRLLERPQPDLIDLFRSAYELVNLGSGHSASPTTADHRSLYDLPRGSGKTAFPGAFLRLRTRMVPRDRSPALSV